MKQLFFITLLATGVTGSAFANGKDKGEENINDITVQQFHLDFPAASNVIWTRESSFEKVKFAQEGATLTAFYDYDNTLMGTMQDVTAAALPANALKSIEKHYSDFTITQVLKYEDNQSNDNDGLYYLEPIHEPLSYFAEVTSEKHAIILKVSPQGEVSFFKQLH